MNKLTEYLLDISESLQGNKLVGKFDVYNYQIQKQSLHSGETRFILHKLIPDEDDVILAWNREPITDDFITVQYYTDDYDCHDMEFTVYEDSINFSFDGQEYTDIGKDDFFNIMMSYDGSKSILDFDNITQLKQYVSICKGIHLLYAKDEEKTNGYI